METQALVLELVAPDTVHLGAGAGYAPSGSWLNATARGVFVLEDVNIGNQSNSSANFGTIYGPDGQPLFFFDGDTSSSGGLWRQWSPKLVVYPGQTIGWNFDSGDTSAIWGLSLSGHWAIGYRNPPV